MIKKLFFILVCLIQSMQIQSMDIPTIDLTVNVRRAESKSSLSRKNSSEKLTDLRDAIRDDKLDAIVALVEKDNDQKWKVIAIREALTLNKFTLVMDLIAKGYPAFYRGESEFVQPLRAAIQSKNAKMVELILEHDDNVNYTYEQGNSYLHMLARIGDQDYTVPMFEMILKKRADIYKKNQAGDTPVDLITRNSAKHLYDVLISCHPEVVSSIPDEQPVQSKTSSVPNTSRRSLNGAGSKSKRNSESLIFEEEDKASLVSTLGYLSLGAASMMTLFAMYAMLFKKDTTEKEKASEQK